MDVRKMLMKTCNSCGASFSSVFLRKKRCQNCYLHYCSTCMDQARHRCRRCLIFAQSPLTKDALNTLRVRDLKWFLSSRNINSETYSEKRELIDLILITVNGPSRRNSSSSGGSEVPRPSAPSSPAGPPPPQATSGLHPQPPPPYSPSSSATSTPRHPNEPLRESDAKNASSKANLNLSTFNLNDIKDEAEIKDLSIRQLKLLLTRNFVDFKGCVEREELIQKTVLLWNDKQISNKFKDDHEDSTVLDENTCKICMENAIDCVLLECGHMLTCTDCGKILSECPVCRQFVTRVVHVFKG